jgi:hypothetical protein
MKIKYPKKVSEFEIQAELYSLLKDEEGYDVRGEVRVDDRKQPKGYRQCRFDLVVYEDKVAKFIIEVKDRKPKNFNKNTRQFKKYSSFGIPLFYCFGLDEIPKFYQIAYDIFNKY